MSSSLTISGPFLESIPDLVGPVRSGQLEPVAGAVLEDGVGGRDTKAVAAFLSFRAIWIEDPHAHRRWVESEEAVRTEAAIAIAQNRQQLDDPVEVTGQVENEVVVAQRLVLNEINSH